MFRFIAYTLTACDLPAPMTPTTRLLSPAERRVLRARAHPLQPVVIVGSKGLTESVLKEAEIALKSHELIKIKLASDDREERASQFLTLTTALSASPVQQIGKIAVLYREKPAEPKAPAPRTRAPAAASQSSRARAASRPPSSTTPKRNRGRSGAAPAKSPPRAPLRPRAARRPRPRP